MIRFVRYFAMLAVGFMLGWAVILTFAALVDAHRIAKSTAETRWYQIFNGQCDVGGTCSIRNVNVDCWTSASHSYDCDYSFRQEKYKFPFTKSYRYCHIYGQLKHRDIIVWWSRNCTGWS